MAEADYYLLGGADDAGGYCDLHGEDHSSEFVYAVNGESRTRVFCLSGVCFTAG